MFKPSFVSTHLPQCPDLNGTRIGPAREIQRRLREHDELGLHNLRLPARLHRHAKMLVHPAGEQILAPLVEAIAGVVRLARPGPSRAGDQRKLGLEKSTQGAAEGREPRLPALEVRIELPYREVLDIPM
jgi:hypothetical protein